MCQKSKSLTTDSEIAVSIESQKVRKHQHNLESRNRTKYLTASATNNHFYFICNITSVLYVIPMRIYLLPQLLVLSKCFQYHCISRPQLFPEIYSGGIIGTSNSLPAKQNWRRDDRIQTTGLKDTLHEEITRSDINF